MKSVEHTIFVYASGTCASIADHQVNLTFAHTAQKKAIKIKLKGCHRIALMAIEYRLLKCRQLIIQPKEECVAILVVTAATA